MAMGAWSSLGGAALPSHFQSHQTAPPCSRNNSAVNSGRRYFSNCSRERRAGNVSASVCGNNVALLLAFLSSSYSSFSNRSRSSRRIWKKLTTATRKPMPTKEAPTVPVAVAA